MILRVLFLSLAICGCTALAHADFTLTPGVDLSVEYNDNIYLDPDHEEDDVITAVSPNLSLSWQTPRLDVSLFASLTMEKYLDHTDEDRIGAGESDQATRLDALAKLYREVLFLRVSDQYSRVTIDEGGRGGENNGTVNLTDSNTLQINPYLKVPVMKDTQLQLGYTYENQWYEKSEGDNADSHLYAASLSKELSARISLTLSGDYKQYRPKNSDQTVIVGDGGVYDYDRKSISAGLSYQATDRLQLQGQYGHNWLDYDVRSDSDAESWNASLDYELTSAFKVGTSYTEDYTVTVEDGPSDTDKLSAYLEYDERYKVKLSLFTSSSDYVEIDRKDDVYGGEISGELPLNDKFGVTWLAGYTNYDQTGQDAETYDRYRARLALYYATRLGRISTGYVYNRNDSDLSSEDYVNNIVFISAALRF